jgi:hypothetical protein
MTRKVLDASAYEDDEVEDATEELLVWVTLYYCKLAVPGDPERCALVLAAKGKYPLEKFWVLRTVAYGRFRGQKKIQRWQSKSRTYDFVVKFDKGDFSDVSPDGIPFNFEPPNEAHKLAFFRSSAFKKRRSASAKKRKSKKKRPYRLPDARTLMGARNRFGYHSDVKEK